MCVPSDAIKLYYAHNRDGERDKSCAAIYRRNGHETLSATLLLPEHDTRIRVRVPRVCIQRLRLLSSTQHCCATVVSKLLGSKNS